MSEYTNKDLTTAKNHLTEAYRHLLKFLEDEDVSGAYDINDVVNVHNTLKDVFKLRESLNINAT
mgnify:CR=1 FL=1